MHLYRMLSFACINEYSRRVEWFMPVLTRLDHERNVGEQLLPFRRAVAREHGTELVTTPFFLHLQTKTKN